jgi:hypothetical protein
MLSLPGDPGGSNPSPSTNESTANLTFSIKGCARAVGPQNFGLVARCDGELVAVVVVVDHLFPIFFE